MTAAPSVPTSTSPRAIALAALVAAVGGSVASAIIAVIAKALGAPDDAQQLQLGAYVSFTVVGVLIGAIGWSIVLRRVSASRALLTRLVPITVVVLFVPDVLIAVGGTATWGTAVALMVMHVAVAAVAVASYARFMPARG